MLEVRCRNTFKRNAHFGTVVAYITVCRMMILVIMVLRKLFSKMWDHSLLKFCKLLTYLKAEKTTPIKFILVES